MGRARTLLALTCTAKIGSFCRFFFLYILISVCVLRNPQTDTCFHVMLVTISPEKTLDIKTTLTLESVKLYFEHIQKMSGLNLILLSK